MPLILALILGGFQGQPAPADALVGSWINQDPSTRGITQVNVRRGREGLLVHAWGKCTPEDCDWGETRVAPSNGLPVATWDHGFAATRMQLIPLPDQRLLVAYKTEYRDQSGRVGKDEVEFLLHEKPEGTGAENWAAKALLSRVAETYRNITTARFESEEITERKWEHSASRRAMHSKTLISQPRRLRVETTGSREAIILISDGKTLWEYFPEANEFIKEPAGAQPLGPSLIGPFMLLEGIREPARILRQERIGDADCAVVEIGREGGLTRTLWIDSKTYMIWKEELDDVSTTEDVPSTRTQIRFTVARIG